MNKVDSREYGIALKEWDYRCAICGKYPVEMHHIIYRRYGKTVKRNLIPLCKTHHDLAHADQSRYTDVLFKLNETKYGKINRKELKIKGKFSHMKFGN